MPSGKVALLGQLIQEKCQLDVERYRNWQHDATKHNGSMRLRGMERRRRRGMEGTRLRGMEGRRLRGMEGRRLRGMEGT